MSWSSFLYLKTLRSTVAKWFSNLQGAIDSLKGAGEKSAL